MKKIYVPNIYEDNYLWNWNLIRNYTSLDLERELCLELPVISVQKSTIEIIDWILQELWINDNKDISIKKLLWRTWFVKVISKDYWEIWIVATKWTESASLFSNISDYYLWASDIWEKLISDWLILNELSKISWEVLWWYKTELLFLLWLNSLSRVVNGWLDISNFEINLIATKFSPILTKKAISMLNISMLRPEISIVDSNSELAIQALEYNNRNSIVWWIEIVQSWASLLATNNALVRNGKIILPSLRNKEIWEFEWEVIWEVNKKSKIWIISDCIKTNIDVYMYKILNNSNNKPKEFINAIIKKMQIINSKI